MTTIKIEVTPEIRKEIIAEIANSLKMIEKEKAYSADLRNYDYIEKRENHVRKLFKALRDEVL